MQLRSRTRQQKFLADTSNVYLAQVARERRITEAVKISAGKRKEIIETHRLNSGQLTPLTSEQEMDLSDCDSVTESTAEAQEGSYDLSTLATIADELYAQMDPHVQLAAAAKISAIFTNDFDNIPKPLLGKLIPQFVGFLKHKDIRLQLQALRGLSNLFANPKAQNQAEVIIECGLISALVTFFRMKECVQFTDATLLLGTIASQSKQWAKQIVKSGPEFHIFGAESVEGVRAVAWMLSKLTQHKPSWSSITPAFPLLSQLIYSPDEDTVINALWALYFITALYQKSDRNGIQSIIEHGVARRVVELTAHHSLQLKLAALHVVLNISTGNDLHVKVLMICRVGLFLAECLRTTELPILRITCSIMSNILAHGCVINQFFQYSDMPRFMNMLITSNDPEVQEEVTRGLSNLMIVGNAEQIRLCANTPIIDAIYEARAAKFPLLLLAREDKTNIFSSETFPSDVFNSILGLVNKLDSSKEVVSNLKNWRQETPVRA